VEHDDATVSVEEAGLLGARALKVADVSFTNASPAAVAPVDRDSVLWLFSLLSLLLGACACSSAAKSLDIAREYSRERYQGGGMIEEYDAVKLMIEGNRAALAAAAAAIMDTASSWTGSMKGAAPCFRAKAAASAASVNAGLDAIQVHGGYGYMRDYGVEKRFRDAATLSVLPLDSTRLLLIGSELAG
jgi:alkylation response protein AidB-like acyl-CoA dehydrogenase